MDQQTKDQRVDSGFDASWHTKAVDTDAERVVPEDEKSTTARSIRLRKIPSNSTNPQTKPSLHSSLPSAKRPSTARKSPAELRRPSISSSSEDSTTKARSRGHRSKQSSHRTSRTFVDPSRPTRHYRINSSHSIPAANRNDIDDVIALHFRSCSLFENPTYYSPIANPIATRNLQADAGSQPSPTESTHTNFITSNHLSENEPTLAGDEGTSPLERVDTTMHWMSPSTRKRQYERIDKANSGLRGFMTKIVPRCVSGPPPEKFYEKDRSDAGSVRRYRMSDDCEGGSDPEDEKDLEKSTSTVRPRQIRTLDRSATTPQVKTKRWVCF